MENAPEKPAGPEVADRQAKLAAMTSAEVRYSPTPSPVRVGRQGERDQSPEYPWQEIGGMITLAGGAYPLLLMVISSPLLLYALVGAIFQEGIVETAMMAIIILVYTIVSSFSALFVTGFVAFPTLVVIALSLRLLGWRPAWDRLGAFCGAAVAMVFAVPLLNLAADSMLNNSFYSGWETCCGLAVIFLTIFVGQVGGAIGGVNIMKAGTMVPSKQPVRMGHFSIAQIMAVMLLASLALTVMRFAGWFRLSVAIAFALWFVATLAGMRPAIWLAKKRWRLSARLGRKRRLRRLQKRPSVEKRKTAVEYWRRNGQPHRQRW